MAHYKICLPEHTSHVPLSDMQGTPEITCMTYLTGYLFTRHDRTTACFEVIPKITGQLLYTLIDADAYY